MLPRINQLPCSHPPVTQTTTSGSCPFMMFSTAAQQATRPAAARGIRGALTQTKQSNEKVSEEQLLDLTEKRLSLLGESVTETKELECPDVIETHSTTTGTDSEFGIEKSSKDTSFIDSTLRPLIKTSSGGVEDRVSKLELHLKMREEMLFEDHTRALILMNTKTHNIDEVNSTACLMFGLPKQSLVGKNIKILIPKSESANWHDQAINSFMEKWRITGAMPFSRAVGCGPRELFAIRARDGGKTESFNIIIRIHPIMSACDEHGLPVYLAGYITDNSLMKQYQTDLYSHKFLYTHTYTPSIETNLFGVITRINPAALELFGYHESHLLNNNIKKIIYSQPIRNQHDSYMARFRESIGRGTFNPDSSKIINTDRNLEAINAQGELLLVKLKVLLMPDMFYGKDHHLIGIFTNTQKFISSEVFKLELKRGLMPSAAIETDVVYNDCCVIDIDLVGSTDYFFKLDEPGIKQFLLPFHKAVQEFADNCCINIIKGTGDGVLVLSSELDRFDSALPFSRIERALLFALCILFWAQENKYKIRIGIAKGQVGAGMIPLNQGRVSWDIYSRTTIQEATRMQTSAFKHSEPSEQQIQISESVFADLQEKYKKLFKQVKYNSGELKGLGAHEATLEKSEIVAYIINLGKLRQSKATIDEPDSKEDSNKIHRHVRKCILHLKNNVDKIQMQEIEIQRLATLRR